MCMHIQNCVECAAMSVHTHTRARVYGKNPRPFMNTQYTQTCIPSCVHMNIYIHTCCELDVYIRSHADGLAFLLASTEQST